MNTLTSTLFTTTTLFVRHNEVINDLMVRKFQIQDMIKDLKNKIELLKEDEFASFSNEEEKYTKLLEQAEYWKNKIELKLQSLFHNHSSHADLYQHKEFMKTYYLENLDFSGK